MVKTLRGIVLVILVGMSAAACASMTPGDMTMRGVPAEAAPPKRIERVQDVPKNESTYHYMVDIYPGLDEHFDPHPTLTLTEYNELNQLDWYCAKRTDELAGRFAEMAKQGVTIGALEGILGTAGAMLGFGPAIKPLEYLSYIGGTGLGGGMANGSISFDFALNVAHGYCMTGMVYKADELEHKLRRIFIVPVYTGHAPLPPVEDRAAPQGPVNKENYQYIPPPPTA